MGSVKCVREYEDHEFCFDIKCKSFHSQESCCLFAVCTSTAKEFHRWLKGKGFKIIKED